MWVKLILISLKSSYISWNQPSITLSSYHCLFYFFYICSWYNNDYCSVPLCGQQFGWPWSLSTDLHQWVGRLISHLVCWSLSQSVDLSDGWSVVWLVSSTVGWRQSGSGCGSQSVGRLVDRMVRQLAVRHSIGRSVGLSVGWSVSQSPGQSISCASCILSQNVNNTDLPIISIMLQLVQTTND